MFEPYAASIDMQSNTRRLRIVATVGYLGLVALLPLWLLILSPPELGNPFITLFLVWLPLLFPLKGILTGKPYTFAWASFVVMIVYIHGLTLIWISPTEWLFTLLELTFATMMFLGGTYYARARGRELGLKVPKLKDLP